MILQKKNLGEEIDSKFWPKYIYFPSIYPGIPGIGGIPLGPQNGCNVFNPNMSLASEKNPLRRSLFVPWIPIPPIGGYHENYGCGCGYHEN